MTLARFSQIARAMLRASFAEAAAYRLESVVWLFATTMPLVMMSLFATVARDAPLRGFSEAHVTAYFLATYIVRTTTGSWAAWQMVMDIRDGTLAVRLLRPAPPLWGYAADNLAALPLRGLVCTPVAATLLFADARGALTGDALLWGAGALAMLGAWLINLLTNLAIGCLAFFIESSLKVVDLYIAAFFLLSGYLIPLPMFPPAARAIADYLPFHFQLGLPVELVTGAHDRRAALTFVAVQWAYVAAAYLTTRALWRRGLRRFAAFGG